MAKTAQQTIYDALRWLGVTDGDETPTSTELVQGLDSLNGMLFNFPARGINYTHALLAATDNINFTDAYTRAVMFMLAAELAPEYDVTLSEGRMGQVANALLQLQAVYPQGTADNTALGVCTQAFRRLRLAVDGEGKEHPSLNWTFMTATISADALRVLNDMLFGFPARGINYTHSTLAAGDALTIGTGNIRNLVMLLTKEFAFNFGVSTNPAFEVEVARAEQQLQAALPIGTADNTALGICYQAFRRLRLSVDGEGKPHPSLNWSFISLTGSTDALRILNDMMFGLPARGINYTHSTLAAGDAVPIGTGNIRNLVLQLVREFGAHFGVTTGEALDAEIIKAEQQLQAAFPPTMNATVIGIINQALQRIRVFAGSGNGGAALPWYFVSATNATDAVRTFNDMMHGLGPRGIAYAHVTLASGDTVNMPDEQIRNLVLLLVKEFANTFGIPIPPPVYAEIDYAERQLQAAYFLREPADSDMALRPRYFGSFSISRID